MAYTFRGGVHVPESKFTQDKPIVPMTVPKTVSIPLSQHIGAHCSPCCKVGDTVLKAQIIGDVEKGLGCPVHSSVSGTVKAFEEKMTPLGFKVTNVVIESDGESKLSPDVRPFGKSVNEITESDVIDVVRRAGISGMGGATFPTYAKISSAVGKVDTLIVNCAECEPFITANHRLLIENPDSVIGGMKILLKAFGIKTGIIGIEDNKKDAIDIFRGKASGDDMLDVRVMKTKYPQGDERQLIYALTDRIIPAGKLPADVKCVVFNAETCAGVYNAFTTGMPLIERVVTVSGDCVKNPGNYLIPIGTKISDIAQFCGGYVKEPYKIVNGGPMMGFAQWDTDSTVTKGTSAILFLSKEYDKQYSQPSACIHCGRCISVCQMHLMPNYIAMFASKGEYDNCEKYSVMSCVECGACSYICPGNVHITALNRAAKTKISEKMRAEKLKQEAKKAKEDLK
ncbi:MAG: electron transport complex subunit RsxC [Clostridia bacterium]|nr:electron transport complex subunit RsxC [Clostridia bacterium]